MIFHQLFDTESSTYTYLVADATTQEAVLIDPVREHIERDLGLVQKLGLKLLYVLDTHIHADHITGAGLIRQRCGAKSGVAATAKVNCVDLALKDGDILPLGKLEIRVIATPGHTNTCLSFYIKDRIFTGDTLFVHDLGRTDFQEGSNENIWDSVKNKIFSLPDSTLVFPAHDYRGQTQSTIADEKKSNAKLGGGKTKEEFLNLMQSMKLALPKKIHIAVPANLKCGLD